MELDQWKEMSTRLECVRSAINYLACGHTLTTSVKHDPVTLAKQFYEFVTGDATDKAEPVFAGRTDAEWRVIQMSCPCEHCTRARAEGRVK